VVTHICAAVVTNLDDKFDIRYEIVYFSINTYIPQTVLKHLITEKMVYKKQYKTCQLV